MIYDGLQLDIRSSSEKEKDWFAIEVYSPDTMLPAFREVGENEWRKYQKRYQDGSGSCVANTVAKMFEVRKQLSTGQSIKFSHAPIYKKRSNKPSVGMIGVNALEIACDTGTCREVDMPSEGLNDKQLDALALPTNFEQLNNDLKPSAFLQNPKNFDYVAATVEKFGCAMVWVETDYASWCKDIPTPFAPKRGEVRHSITAVDAVTYNGVQYLVIEDSWGEFGIFHGQRLITREMFNDAVIFGAIFTDFMFNITDHISYPFNTIMRFGEKSAEIVRWQKYLQSKGFFPTNVECTGYYGNVTRKATLNFQTAFNVASAKELAALAGKRVGAKTLAAANSML